MSALTYEAAKKHVMSDRGAGQERVRGRRTAVTRNAERDERREEAELRHGRLDELAELARQLAERVVEAAPELLAERDVPEAVPRVGVAVDERRPERRRRAAAARGTRATTRDSRRRAHASDEPPAAPDRGSTGEHEQADRRAPAAASASGCRPPARTRTAAATSQRSRALGVVAAVGAAPAQADERASKRISRPRSARWSAWRRRASPIAPDDRA